jgi:hypothetical protein
VKGRALLRRFFFEAKTDVQLSFGAQQLGRFERLRALVLSSRLLVVFIYLSTAYLDSRARLRGDRCAGVWCVFVLFRRSSSTPRPKNGRGLRSLVGFTRSLKIPPFFPHFELSEIPQYKIPNYFQVFEIPLLPWADWPLTAARAASTDMSSP